ncbi:MAG: HAD family hydrolase [Leptolyngbyaceae cyanobacterium]
MLKAVFLEFRGVIIRDEALRRGLVDALLLGENLRPNAADFVQMCRGRGDHTCLQGLLTQRGRVVTEDYLNKLLAKQSGQYCQQLADLERLPIYPGLTDWLYQLKVTQIPAGIVTAAQRQDVEWVLAQANLSDSLAIWVTDEDIALGRDKPAAAPYQLALTRLNEQHPTLQAKPEDCLAIEASFNGIAAAQAAGVPVAGVAHQYPYRMIQRRADWVVDYLNELDLDWLRKEYG